MPSPTIEAHLTADHRRLEALLAAAESREPIDSRPYGEFRRALLRHIALEEKILLPAAQRARDGVPLEVAARLRLDHGAIAALLVPTPTPMIVATLRQILQRHDEIEEGSAGLYSTCDRLLSHDVGRIVADMEAQGAVAVNAHNDGPGVMAAVERALERGGYRFVRA
jgi:hypothetical protein